MKTKQFIISALLLSASLLVAQTSNKQATVRIKKTININGVETTTDTTYTASDAASVKMDKDNATVEEYTDENGQVKKIVIMDSETDKPQINITESADGKRSIITINSDKEIAGNNINKTTTIDQPIGKNGGTTLTVINTDGKMTPGEEAMMSKIRGEMSPAYVPNNGKGANFEPNEGQQLMIKKVRCGARKGEIDSVQEYTTIIIGKKINIMDANTDEIKQINKTTGISDNKLAIDKINFYPNPNNGKFQMTFTLPKKANTEISIMSIEGKTIYNEKLPNFSGNYDKEIDISQNPKGAYFVKISQGNNSLLKKIVIE